MALGRPMVTLPIERAKVALALAERGMDGIGRVQDAVAEIDAAAKLDFSISDRAAGRV